MCCIVKCCNCHILLIGCGYGWCGILGIGVCVCVLGWKNGKRYRDAQSVRVLWYHSYLVWLLFGDSIPICSFIFFLCFFVT